MRSIYNLYTEETIRYIVLLDTFVTRDAKKGFSTLKKICTCITFCMNSFRNNVGAVVEAI